MDFWTIGHSTRSLEEFLRLLREHQIQQVADVRRFPMSRRHPQFNQAPLQQRLAKEGIGYQHLIELGGRRAPLPDSPNVAWRNLSFRGYADHMSTPEFARGTERLLQLGLSGRVAILCAELLWWRCHRALIADYLKARGHQVCHILGPEKSEEHPFTGAARIVQGGLSYTSPTRGGLEPGKALSQKLLKRNRGGPKAPPEQLENGLLFPPETGA